MNHIQRTGKSVGEQQYLDTDETKETPVHTTVSLYFTTLFLVKCSALSLLPLSTPPFFFSSPFFSLSLVVAVTVHVAGFSSSNICCLLFLVL